MNVATIERKGDKAAILVMEDHTRVWTPEFEAAKDLVGKPIPSSWTQKTGDYGPQALPPKPEGNRPQAAFRNTKEGFLLEQQGWREKEAANQHGLNRRTALMQAVIIWADQAEQKPTLAILLSTADSIFDWLTKGEPTSGAAPRYASETPPPAGAVPGVSPADTAEPESPIKLHIPPEFADDPPLVCASCGRPESPSGRIIHTADCPERAA